MKSGIENFTIQGSDLLIGSIPVRLLAERAGSTPFYAYDRAAITRRVQELRSALPKEVHLHYAMKANPMPAVVQHLAKHVDGLDVASAREMIVALDTGMSAEHISFAGPGKSDAEIRRAVAASITLNIESTRELQRACQAGEELGVVPRVALRINPSFELKSAGMKMGGSAKQFGIDAELVPSILKSIKELACEFQGFHIFSGSQNLRAEAIAEAQSKTLEYIVELSNSVDLPIKVANIGGGFGIPYAPNDKPLDLQSVGDRLNDALHRFRMRLPQTRVVIELGRFLVGEAGVYVCRVIDRKISRGQVFLVTDGGLHHHLSATGNFGQVIRRNYPIVVANRMDSPRTETVHVVGPLCTPLDLLGNAVELPETRVGDLIAILQSGAYGLTASPSAFLSHPPATEMLI